MSYNARVRARQNRVSAPLLDINNNESQYNVNQKQGWEVGTTQADTIGIPPHLVRKYRVRTNTIVKDSPESLLRKDTRGLLTFQTQSFGVGTMFRNGKPCFGGFGMAGKCEIPQNRFILSPEVIMPNFCCLPNLNWQSIIDNPKLFADAEKNFFNSRKNLLLGRHAGAGSGVEELLISYINIGIKGSIQSNGLYEYDLADEWQETIIGPSYNFINLDNSAASKIHNLIISSMESTNTPVDAGNKNFTSNYSEINGVFAIIVFPTTESPSQRFEKLNSLNAAVSGHKYGERPAIINIESSAFPPQLKNKITKRDIDNNNIIQNLLNEPASNSVTFLYGHIVEPGPAQSSDEFVGFTYSSNTPVNSLEKLMNELAKLYK
jgi:hypothetical protein